MLLFMALALIHNANGQQPLCRDPKLKQAQTPCLLLLVCDRSLAVKTGLFMSTEGRPTGWHTPQDTRAHRNTATPIL